MSVRLHALAAAVLAALLPAAVLAADGAAPATATRGAAEPPCSFVGNVGQAVKWKSKLSVGAGGPVDKSPLRRGQAVTTNRRGKGQICLKRGRWRCTVFEDTRVVVVPSGTDLAIRLKRGEVECGVGDDDPQELDTENSSLTFGGDVLEPARLANDGGARAGGKVFALSVRRGRTVLRVFQGAVVLAKKGVTAGRVVVGKREEGVVGAGRLPRPPRTIEFGTAQQKRLASLARTVPVERDQTPPDLRIVGGPRAQSSIRTASFTFEANEPAIFSCALDGQGKDIRVCTSPQPYPRLAPGTHTFFVRATDAAGNVATASHTWTVDASMIAFASQRDGNPEIYRVDPDQGNLTRLTTDVDVLQSDENPSWGPGHRRVAFDRLVGRNLDIYAVDADGGGAVRLTEHPAADRNPSWSPDGTKIAFESYRDGNRDIYIMSAEGTERDVVRVTTNQAEDLDPTWSPDGRSIAFSSNRAGAYNLYVVSVGASGQPTQLTNERFADIGATWAPASRIAFHSNRTLGNNNIYVVNPDGSGLARVTITDDADENPSWAPDGVHLVFQRRTAAGTQLRIIDFETREQIEITPPGRDYVPDW